MTEMGSGPIPVFVVLWQPALLLDAAGPLEVMRVANRERGSTLFDVRYVGPASSVVTSIGLALTGLERLPDELPDNAMVMVSGDVSYVMTRDGWPAPQRDEAGVAAIVEWLRSVVRPGHKVVCICSGALLAAKAGLLDGYQCTTHYECLEELMALAPGAKVVENRLFVEDRDRYTSAGVTSGIDLMLYLVSQIEGHARAAEIAKHLVVYLRRSGSDPQLSPWLEGRNHLHPAVHRVQDAISADPTRCWTLSGLSRVAGSSSRHLTRLFHEHAGMSITDYKNSLRAALAKELLSQTSLDMEHVAERSGFASTRQLRRVWKRLYETAPREARSRMVH